MAAPGPVLFDYDELLGEPSAETVRKIEAAYSYDGLGILAVRGIPGFVEARAKALPFAWRFGQLPEATKAKYELPEASYSFGWSHGKEKMSDGKPDTFKGSYYFNPLHDRPVEDSAAMSDPHLAPFVHPNVWPSEEDCPGFPAACKQLGSLMVDVGALLARHVDAYVREFLARHQAAPPGESERLATVVRTSRTPKARLLLYFPNDASAPDDSSSTWCGWHNDHGSLTALCSAMYMDAQGMEVPCPDPAAGLYIRNRKGETVRMVTPADCLAFQIGETAQVHSGGALQATPHYVRAAFGAPGVSRATLAVFMEPEYSGIMRAPQGTDKELLLRGAAGELLPPGVPTLASRWDGDAQTFAQFNTKTLASYY